MSRSQPQAVTVTMSGGTSLNASVVAATSTSQAQQVGVSIAGASQTVSLRPVD